MYHQLWLATMLSLIHFVMSDQGDSFGSTLAMSAGNDRIELAKITGITPDWLTFNGMEVLWPPIIRRPTTRRANCTGMRRWPDSTNTIPTIIATPMRMIVKNCSFDPSVHSAEPCAGRRETTDAKIRIDM